MSKQKSVSRQKKEATHEFFPRNKPLKQVSSETGTSFTFNKAPINKSSAYLETKTKVMAENEGREEDIKHNRKSTTFMSKLYQDDDEYDQLKVHGVIDEDDQEANAVRNEKTEAMAKRKAKALEKMGTKKAVKVDKSDKIGKLNLKKDSLAMFAISEVNRDYLIVNHTRNTKGYISLMASDMKENNFKKGQMVMAMVSSEIKGATTGDVYNFQSGKAGQNKKVQLTLELRYMNKLLSVDKVSKNMVLPAKVESREAKGFIVDLGFKDNTKGFLKVAEQTDTSTLVGKRVYIVVKTIIASSKIIKCELLNKDNKLDCVQQAAVESNLDDNFKLTAAQMKPGYLVHSKVSNVLVNGVELTYLGGLTGTVFEDHLDPNVKDLKVGSKLDARIVSVDPITKKVTLSTLPHIVNWSPDTKNSKTLPKIGETFQNVKIARVLYGASYQIDLGTGVDAFLHKLHITKEEQPEEEVEEVDENEVPVKRMHIDQPMLTIGDKLPEVKVKEINFFDLMPVLSYKDTVVKEENLNYHMIAPGAYLEVAIEKINEEHKYVTLRVNKFVRGNLHIENMADHPIKQMPPKLLEVGKKVRVRVLNVNVGKRFIEFTKKDSFMKDDAPVYQSYKEVKKGNKVICNVVSHCEHGVVVKSFGNIKGLITYEDIKAKENVSTVDEKQYKAGTVLKAYVLFKKADKGLALTMSKKKAKATGDDVSKDHYKTLENNFLPNEEEMEQILSNTKYSTMLKQSRDSELVGQVLTFRLLESPEDEERGFYIVKSLDAEKKSKNFIGLLPKCLVSNFACFSSSLINSSSTFKGLIIEIFRDNLPVVSIQPDLIALKSEIADKSKDEELTMTSGQSYIGICNGLHGMAGQVSVRFLNGVSKSIKVKDLNTTSNYESIYTPGKILRVAVNKLERLCTKQQVLRAALSSQGQITDLKAQMSSFGEQYMQSIQTQDDDEEKQDDVESVRIGQTVQIEVQLVKDYGVIGQIMDQPGSNIQTGFILNDHKIGGKYKAGQKLTCRVLDVDSVKKIADLKELPKGTEDQGQIKTKFKADQKHKVVVELIKDDYLIVSFKNSRATLGICLAKNFNQDSDSQDIQIGDEVEVQVNKLNKEGGFYELIQVPKETKKKRGDGSGTLSELKPGIKVNGQIKSIKAQCIYVQLPKSQENPKQVQIGRLHMIECQSISEFKSFAVNDRIECKILHIQKDKGTDRTWIEMTRSEKHLVKHEGLDEDQMKDTPLSFDDLKEGQSYSAMIVSSSMLSDEPMNLKFSQPIQLQISPFIRGVVSFNHIEDASSIAKSGSISAAFKVGDRVSATYQGNSNFSLLSEPSKVKTKSFKKGDLLTVRFVKYIIGKGLSVQLALARNDHQYGFIPICELSDEIKGNAARMISERSIFAARVIEFESKTGKPILSTRQSIVDSDTWMSIAPESTSLAFKNADEQKQFDGNMRNKILKYGAGLALERGNLALGYVTNIGKAGCFVQLGHNCTARAGLNDLSDSPNFNFAEEMPLGRLVLGRVTKVEEGKNNMDKRFSFSARQSIAVYGVGVIDRSKLQVDDEAEVIVMAIAEGKAFAQIKGSYIKIKVKEIPAKLKVGEHVTVSLKKVTKEKISSVFLKKLPESQCISEEQKRVQVLYNAIEKEARSSLPKIKAFISECQGKTSTSNKQTDFDPSLIDQKNFLGRDEQIAQQIADLEELDENDQVEGSGDNEEMEAAGESDEDEIKRLTNIKYDSDEEMEEEGEQEQSDDDDQADADVEDSDENEGENDKIGSIHDDESMEDEDEGDIEEESQSEEETNQKLVGKKRTLKDRLKEEMVIRAKEKEMRSGKDQPKDIDDFERLLVSNQDQSYLWIQYIAFMLDNIGIDAGRKVAERAVKNISISNEEDKLNIWTAFMNLESNFGTQVTLEKVTKRALDVNDRKRVYVNLINIYKSSQNFEYIEPIFKQLVKKYSNSIDLWGNYLEFMFEMRSKQKDKNVVAASLEFTEPKAVLQKSMQALTKDQHVNMISKFGMLEFKSGNPESGRTMFEGIVTNYPKRMDIWAIYMDMESKYGGGNKTQARHLFERCLSNEHIQKKPKKMKLVFQKYMEYEKTQGNANKLIDLRKRVEEYLSKAFGQADQQDEEDSN